MKHLFRSLAAIAIITLIGCGGKEEKKDEDNFFNKIYKKFKRK